MDNMGSFNNINFKLSLPVPSTFTANTDLIGITQVRSGSGSNGSTIIADTTTPTLASVISNITNLDLCVVSFTYIVK